METIILVHGIGLWATEMFLLKYRFRLFKRVILTKLRQFIWLTKRNQVVMAKYSRYH